jgi:succinoglycan biosynthesis transport protein ExoP
MRRQDNHEIFPANNNTPEGRDYAFSPSARVFQDHNFTWEQVIRVMRKNLRFGLILASAVTGLALLYAVVQRDFYRPTARLEIAPPGGGIKTLHEIESPAEPENQDYLETQVQILGSDALAVSVIRELNLEKNPEFAGTEENRDLSERKSSAMMPGVVPSELAILQDQLDLANLNPAETAALERFRRGLSVSSVRNTRLVEISCSSHDPRLAQLITNTLVTKFIDQNYRHRYTSTMQASEWLSSQLSDLRRKVDESAQEVAEYQKKFGLVEVDDRDVPMSQLMGEVNRKLSEAQASRIEEEAFVRMIDQGHGDAIPSLRDDKLYQDLMIRYADLRTQLAQARTVYGDANSNVQKLQDQISEVSIQIDAERKRALGRTRSSFTAAKHRERLMMDERDRLRSRMGHMTSQLAAYHMLKNEANAKAELYNTLQGRLREAGIYAGLRSSNIRVVDLATNLLKPTGPHRATLVFLGGVLGCLFAVVLSFVRESFHNTLRTPDDVRSWTGLPSLALLPSIGAESAKQILDSGGNWKFTRLWQLPKAQNEGLGVSIMKSPTDESEAMRELRTSLLNSKQGNAPQVILISSSTEGEGKTTVAVNFAIALAQLGKTCLVDADLRQPAVARAFGIAPKVGLTDVLKSSIPLASALVYFAEYENLAVLPGGTMSENPADALSSLQMKKLVDALRQYCDYIVIDSPPVIRFSDARFLSSLADDVVLVGRCGITTRRAMQRTTELLNEVHASVAGMVVNGVDLSSPDYDYYTYGYRAWWGKRREEARTGNTDAKGPGDNDKPAAMGAHA